MAPPASTVPLSSAPLNTNPMPPEKVVEIAVPKLKTWPSDTVVPLARPPESMASTPALPSVVLSARPPDARPRRAPEPTLVRLAGRRLTNWPPAATIVPLALPKRLIAAGGGLSRRAPRRRKICWCRWPAPAALACRRSRYRPVRPAHDRAKTLPDRAGSPHLKRVPLAMPPEKTSCVPSLLTRVPDALPPANTCWTRRCRRRSCRWLSRTSSVPPPMEPPAATPAETMTVPPL